MNIIAVIDDGVNEKFFPCIHLLQSFEITKDLQIRKSNHNCAVKISHGTLCAAIICKFAPNANIISIKITNSDTMKSTKRQLFKAFEWCEENHIKLINLSMGTADSREFSDIRQEVNRLFSKGIIIVSAYNNLNIYTYPASLPNVIGVFHGSCNLEKNHLYYCDKNPNAGEHCFAVNADYAVTDCYGNTIHTGYSNSFAAPFVTSAVYKLLEHKSNASSVLTELQRESLQLSAPFQDYCVKHRDLCNNIETPIIAICYSDNNSLNNMIKIMLQLFKKDGYSPLAFTDGDTDTYMDIIPLRYYNRNWQCSISYETLQIMSHIYDPSIFILCLTLSSFERLKRAEFDCIITQSCDFEPLEKQFIKTPVIRYKNMDRPWAIDDIKEFYHTIVQLYQ